MEENYEKEEFDTPNQSVSTIKKKEEEDSYMLKVKEGGSKEDMFSLTKLWPKY